MKQMKQLCACGCGQLTSGKWNWHTQKYAQYIRGHINKGKNPPMLGKHHSTETKKKQSLAKAGKEYLEAIKEKRDTPCLCKCGCGQLTTGKWNSQAKKFVEYVRGHQCRGKKRSEETRKKHSLTNTGKEHLEAIKEKGDTPYLCKCGCGQQTSGEWSNHTKKFAQYVNGHQFKGKNHPLFGLMGEKHPSFGRRNSLEQKRKMSESQGKGEKNHNWGKHRSIKTRKQISESKKGEKNPNWKGGKDVHKDGYVYIKNPTHPFCNGKGYVGEHRLKMEKYLGRYLKPEEIVHHIDGNHGNNAEENLELFSNIGEYAKQCMLKGGAIKANAGIKNPSKPQVKLFHFIKQFYPEAQLNFPVKIREDKGYSLDVAIPNLNIDYEYDEPQYHKNRQTEDFYRDENLIEKGWCVVRIKGEKELTEVLKNHQISVAIQTSIITPAKT